MTFWNFFFPLSRTFIKIYFLNKMIWTSWDIILGLFCCDLQRQNLWTKYFWHILQIYLNIKQFEMMKFSFLLVVTSHSPGVIVSKTTRIGQLLIESRRKLDFTWNKGNVWRIKLKMMKWYIMIWYDKIFEQFQKMLNPVENIINRAGKSKYNCFTVEAKPLLKSASSEVLSQILI